MPEFFMYLGVAAVISGVAAMLFRLYKQRSQWQLRRLHQLIKKAARRTARSKSRESQLLQRTYLLLSTAIHRGDAALAYQAVELLKQSFGEGMTREDEPIQLMGLVAASLRIKQGDVAAHILAAFRPLLRNTPAEQLSLLAEQLELIGVLAYKEKQFFLITKVMEAIFEIMERRAEGAEPQQLVSVLQAIRMIGNLALRRKDTALFREIGVRLTQCLDDIPLELSEKLAVLLIGWLHRIAYSSAYDMLAILEGCVWRMLEQNKMTDTAMQQLWREWRNIAAMSCLNLQDRLAPWTVTFCFLVAEQRQQLASWRTALEIGGHIARVAVAQHGLPRAFPFLFPLLDTGRRLFNAELKFGRYGEADDWRARVLFNLAQEVLHMANLLSRSTLTQTPGDVIAEVFHCWLQYPACSDICISEKSVKKFCQFLFLFWVSIWRRQARKGGGTWDKELMEPILIPEGDRERLGLTGVHSSG